MIPANDALSLAWIKCAKGCADLAAGRVAPIVSVWQRAYVALFPVQMTANALYLNGAHAEFTYRALAET